MTLTDAMHTNNNNNDNSNNNNTSDNGASSAAATRAAHTAHNNIHGADRRPYAVVTGGAGFIGSHVVDRLVAEGYEVAVIDVLFTGHARNLAHHAANQWVHFIQRDIRESLLDVALPTAASNTIARETDVVVPACSSSSTAASATATSDSPSTRSDARERTWSSVSADHRCHRVQIDCIFHFACPAAPDHYQAEPIFTTMTCVVGTHNVLQLATQHSCPVVIASTSEVYGNPSVHPQNELYLGNVSCTGVRACYDEGKRCAEALAFDFHRQHGTKIRVARIFNTYGPRMTFEDGRVVSNFVLNALQGKPLVVYGSGTQTRSLQYVDDLVEALWRFMHHPTETGPLNLGSQDERTVNQIALDVLDAVAEVRGGEGPSPSAVTHGDAAPDDPFKRLPDITRARACLGGWTPCVPLRVGLMHTARDFQARLRAEAESEKGAGCAVDAQAQGHAASVLA